MQNIIDGSALLFLLAVAYLCLEIMKHICPESYKNYRTYVRIVVFIEIIFAFLYKYQLK